MLVRFKNSIESNKHQKLNMMKRMIILIAALISFFATSSEAQQYYCESSAGNLYAVAAKSGLSLRAAPTLVSPKILAVPFGKEVTVCSEYQSEPQEIGGTQGHWVRAWYRGKEGYMFNAYLEAQAPIEVLYAGLGLAEDEEYFGLYEKEGFYHVQKYPLTTDSMLTDGTLIASELTQIKGIQDPLFLFSGIETKKTENIIGRQFDSKFLFPGESVYLETEQAAYYVYAKGSVVSNDDENNPNPFSMIRNYQLRVRKVSGEDSEDQVLYQLNIPAWYGEGYEGGIQLQWIGDLDNDGELDMLLTTATQSNCTEVVFLLSSKAERGHLLRQVSRVAECGC